MFRLFERGALVIASILLLLLAGFTVFDVIGRNLFRSPLAGATELTELALVGMTFLIYPYLARRRRHIVVDLFDNLMTPLVRRVQAIVSALLGAAIFGALAWRLWIIGERTVGYGDSTPYFNIPVGYAIQFMAVFAGLSVIGFIVSAFDPPGDDRPGDRHVDRLT